MAGWGSGLAAPASSYFRVGRGRQPAFIESATAQLDVSRTEASISQDENERVVAAARALGRAVKPITRTLEGSGGKEPFGSAFVLEFEGQYAAITATHVVSGPEPRHIGIGAGGMARWPNDATRIVSRDPALPDPDITVSRFRLTSTDDEGASDAVPLEHALMNFTPLPGMTLLAAGHPTSRSKMRYGPNRLHAGVAYISGDAVQLEDYARLGLDPRVHIALHYAPERVHLPDGSAARGPAPPGMSGGPIFMVGDSTETGVVLLLAGVVTEFRPGPPSLLVGTRIDALLDHLAPFRPPEDRLFAAAG